MRNSFLKISFETLRDWIAMWGRGRDVFGPQPWAGGTDWAPLTGGALPDLSPGTPKRSLKLFYFPQPETLFTFSARPGEKDAFLPIPPAGEGRKRVIVGVRPCDARSVTLNAMPYQGDPYYAELLKNTALVGVSCLEGCRTCFCTWTGGSPMGTEGLDIALHPADGYLIAEILTERGEALVAEAGGAFEPAGQEDVDAVEAKRAGLARTGSSVPDPACRLREKDLLALHGAPFWEEIASSCINCGACTFLCPTCYCFDIQDEVARGEGRRIRYWDSCMFPLFTLHASGHNPRGQKVQRVRNRFMHKLKYFPDRFGPLSCVGCGRCIRECPVNIDIREVMRSLLET